MSGKVKDHMFLSQYMECSKIVFVTGANTPFLIIYVFNCWNISIIFSLTPIIPRLLTPYTFPRHLKHPVFHRHIFWTFLQEMTTLSLSGGCTFDICNPDHRLFGSMAWAALRRGQGRGRCVLLGEEAGVDVLADVLDVG